MRDFFNGLMGILILGAFACTGPKGTGSSFQGPGGAVDSKVIPSAPTGDSKMAPEMPEVAVGPTGADPTCTEVNKEKCESIVELQVTAELSEACLIPDSYLVKKRIAGHVQCRWKEEGGEFQDCGSDRQLLVVDLKTGEFIFTPTKTVEDRKGTFAFDFSFFVQDPFPLFPQQFPQAKAIIPLVNGSMAIFCNSAKGTPSDAENLFFYAMPKSIQGELEGQQPCSSLMEALPESPIILGKITPPPEDNGTSAPPLSECQAEVAVN